MINKKEFENQKFESYGVIESRVISPRVPLGWRIMDNKAELREKLRDIMYEKNEIYRSERNINTGDFPLVETRCAIPVDSMKKIISGRYKLSREVLAKFVVGMNLNIEEANNLFGLHSFPLYERNAFDFIVIHALKTKDTVHEFMDEVYEFLGKKLDKDM